MTERAPRRVKRPSGFQFEMRRAGALLDRWISHELNRYFDLSVQGAGYRGIRTLVLVLAICVLAFVIHLLILLNPFTAQATPIQLSELIRAGVITAVRIALLLGIALLFGRQLAGDYLADIFEIKDLRVAWEFLDRQVSGGGSEVLHLREGRIAAEDQNSPLVLIGGPGYVITDNDTAALFERPDGTPHVVGPAAGTKASSRTALVGFERLREPIISLRDQYIGSLGGAPMSVVSRSLDGMPISAVDVRGVYSIRRSPTENEIDPGSDVPYPFDPLAIEDLIYNQAVPVLTDGPYPSGQPAGWNHTMQDLIRGSLAEFMSHNRLGEYVAGVGQRELELSEFRDDTILSQTLRLSTEVTEVRAPGEPPKPRFHPRTELTTRFLGSREEFAKRARSDGLELHWMGVGTWKIPDDSSSEAVQQKHLEAWRIHRETAARADPKALEEVAQRALVEEKLRLIREVPFASHQKNQARYSEKGVLIECLLQDFWEQMGDALNVCYDHGPLAPAQTGLERAVAAIEELLKIRQLGYLVGGGTMSRVKPRAATTRKEPPPAPSSRTEADKYRALLSKLGGDYRVAEGMIANESKRHPNQTREQLIQRILTRFERYGH